MINAPQSARHRTVRVFLSSTFADLHRERDALQVAVWPELERRCALKGVLFRAVDLRWGVPAAAALQHDTMAICLEEIALARRESPRPNFVVILGDRYGWRPLPTQIPLEEFAALVGQIPQVVDLALLKAWYPIDLNSIPPAHRLRPCCPADLGNWPATEGILRRAIQGAAHGLGLAHQRELAYFGSATEQECWEGLLASRDAHEHVVGCFVERAEAPYHGVAIDKLADGSPDPDAGQRLAAFRSALRQRLGERGRDFAVRPQIDHLAALCNFVLDTLWATIAAELAHPSQMAEVQTQAGRMLIGRQSELARIAAYLNDRAAQPLVVHGPVGIGKSALLAQSALLAKGGSAQVVLIGANSGLEGTANLLADVLTQLGVAAEEVQSLARNPNNIAELWVEHLASAAKLRPISLFLDGLADETAATTWLPTRLPESVRVIVACRGGRALDDLLSRGCTALALGPLSKPELGEILDDWLSSARRRLQPAQRNAILDAADNSGNPLHLNLLYKSVRQFTSDQVFHDLAIDASGAAQSLIAYWSADSRHGPAVVRKTLALLAQSRDGLAESELVACLDSDPELLADLARRLPDSPRSEKLPDILWSRWMRDLRPHLREVDFHGTRLLVLGDAMIRQVARVAFLSDDAGRRAAERLWRLFASQPSWFGHDIHRLPNVRKSREMPLQLCATGRWDELRQLLVDDAFIELSFAAGQASNLIAWQTEVGPASDIVQAIASQAQLLSLVPLATVALRASLGLSDELTRRRYLQDHPGHVLLLPCSPQRPDSLGLRDAFREHSAAVWAVCAHPREALVFSGGDDYTLQSWQAEKGTCLRTWSHHRTPVSALAVSPCGRWLASGDMAGEIWHVDLAAGRSRLLCNGSGGGIWTLAVDSSGRFLAAGGAYGYVRLFDLQEGGAQDWPRLPMLSGVVGLAFWKEGTQLLVASRDGHLRSFSTTTKRRLRLTSRSLGVLTGVALGSSETHVYLSLVSGEVLEFHLPDGQWRKIYSGGARANTLVLAPAGDVLAVAFADESVAVLDPGGSAASRHARLGGGPVRDVCFDMSRRTVHAACEDGLVRRLHLDGPYPTLQKGRGTCALDTFPWTPFEMSALKSCGTDLVRGWDLRALSPCGQAAVFSRSGEIVVVSLADGRILQQHSRWWGRQFLALAGGDLIIGSNSSTQQDNRGFAESFRASSGQSLTLWGEPGRWTTAMAGTPDGRCMAMGGEGGFVRLLRVDATSAVDRNWDPIGQYQFSAAIGALWLNAAGTLLAVATIHGELWLGPSSSLTDQRGWTKMPIRHSPIQHLVWLPKQQALMVVGQLGDASLWDTARPALVGESLLPPRVRWIRITPGGALAVNGPRGTDYFHFWSVAKNPNS